jgi:hypothetical protein
LIVTGIPFFVVLPLVLLALAMEMSFAVLWFAHRQYLRCWQSNPVKLVSVFKVTKETSVV